MSFEAYIKNIEVATNKTVVEIKHQATLDGIINNPIHATTFVKYLKDTYDLGRGHAMALWKYFIKQNWLEPLNSSIKK